VNAASDKVSRVIPWIWLILPAAWFWRVLAAPNAVWAWPGGHFSDLLITHLPNAEFVHRALATWHQLPLWNPTILSGMPTVGDPLAGLWYPPMWPTIIWPSVVTFNVIVWLHLAWAGWGMYRLARSEGLAIWPALVSGILFSGSPKLIGQAALGHVTLVMAVAWTPWWLLALSASEEHPVQADYRRVWQGVRSGTVLGLIFLADPRWLIPAVFLGGAFTLRRWLSESWGMRDVFRDRLAGWLVAAAQAGLVAAVLALPMWQLVSLSTRQTLTASESSAFSLPPARLLGLFIPDLGGWPEWITYAGMVGLTLTLVAVLLNGRGWRFWGLVAIGGWALALGDHSPIYPFLIRIVPGLAWQRVPARFLFLSITGIAMLAGIGLDGLLRPGVISEPIPWFRRIAFAWTAMFATLGVVGVLLAGSWGAPEFRWSLILTGAVGTLGGAGVVFAGRLRRWGWHSGVFWASLVILEFILVDGTLVVARPVPSVSVGARSTAPGTHETNAADRVFSPSYSVPQNVAAEAGLQLADGVNPLQLRAYWDYMAQAVGFEPGQYSVTLPPFPGGDPGAEMAWSIDSRRLGWLDVQRVVSSYPLLAKGLVPEGTQGEMYFYFNQNVAPRAWVQRGAGLDLASTGSQARIVSWSPNQIQIEANGPGRLVLSEIVYPGWGVTVDGVGQTLEPAGGLLRSVVLGEGRHEVRLAFIPVPALWGAGLSSIGLLLALLAWRRR
jgi:hypothetical protein